MMRANWFKDRRLDVIDGLLARDGYIRRSDLIREFGISSPQASADIAGYMAEHPDCLRYDLRAKRYVAVYRPHKRQRRVPFDVRQTLALIVG